METMIDSSSFDAYEGMIYGPFSMSCHTNAQVQSSALGVIDYTLTRFGWVMHECVTRILLAVSLWDEDKQGNLQGKHKHFTEILK
eukprot:13706940-Ditylum_brightwellii.AAC.1